MTSTIDLGSPATDEQLIRVFGRLVAGWLPERRWFGGKGRSMDAVRVVSCAQLHDGESAGGERARMWHLLVEVRFSGGEAHTYQIFLGARATLPDHLRHVALPDPDKLMSQLPAGVVGQGALECYDALHDPEMTSWMLDRLAAGDTVGPLRFATLTGTSIRTGLRSLVLTGEQSNTSLVFGDEYIAKVFRRIAPGRNPDLELNLALAHVGSPHVAEPVGWADCQAPADSAIGGSGPATSLIVQRFLRSATDGWSMALASARDFLAADPPVGPGQAGGDFSGEAERLGRATAQVHQDLANSLPTRRLGPADLAGLSDSMFAQLEATCARVPQLRPYEADLRDRLGELTGSAGLGGLVFAQRVHGDYHLGQVLRTTQGWKLLDFEGEPARSVAERRAVASPFKDVAGMLRSFDYAAQSVALDERGENSRARAQEWSEWNRQAFTRGYSAISGHDPQEHAIALRAFEIEKAVYEVAYEAANRPSWLSIPLAACARLSVGE
ncbi:MAG TPA: aminoglycoside phosphotransferase [Actinocrinis sp.]|nr:aminoglycoside phosphotransferase [Actinocrinis sp.]